MIVSPRKLVAFRLKDGRVPFDEWLCGLSDPRAAARILARLVRVRCGNLGDCQGVGDGVTELRVDYGPGYREYFGQQGPTVVVLLCGGDKRTQQRDIQVAKAYWHQFKKKSYENSEL
jgi:putative addiction module killer protein